MAFELVDTVETALTALQIVLSVFRKEERVLAIADPVGTDNAIGTNVLLARTHVFKESM